MGEQESEKKMNVDGPRINQGGMSDEQAPAPRGGKPRVMGPKRDQVEWRVFDMDALIPEDHRARTLWEAVEQMDLSSFYDAIRSREEGPGRDAYDPMVLLALWLYATSEGVGSARQVSRLCERDHPYMWICGGLKPNYHALSDFRSRHGDKLDKVLTELLGSLMAAGLLKIRRVAQDGTRTRANAGASSFRRESTLLGRSLKEAEEQVAALKRELEEDPSASDARERAARERAARERHEAVKRAVDELPKVQAAHERTQKKRAREQARRRASKLRRKARKTGEPSHTTEPEEQPKEPRVSTTDPEARIMKMGDSGFRPGYNLQFATDTASRFIVGFDVTNEGTDRAQLLPMLDQIEQRTGRRPDEALVDGGYTALEAIHAAEIAGTRMYAPVSKPRTSNVDPYAPKRGDTPATAAWRARMKDEDAKTIYKERAAVSETIHADLRAWRGLGRLPVRGRAKVRAVGLLLLPITRKRG